MGTAATKWDPMGALEYPCCHQKNTQTHPRDDRWGFRKTEIFENFPGLLGDPWPGLHGPISANSSANKPKTALFGEPTNPTKRA